jgi:hypothetical protein
MKILIFDPLTVKPSTERDHHHAQLLSVAGDVDGINSIGNLKELLLNQLVYPNIGREIQK